MDLAAAGLREQAFRTHGKPITVVPLASQQQAIEVLNKTLASPTGLAVIQGPSLSGKTTLLRHFLDGLPESCSSAIVDGAGMNTTTLLEALLRQFGYVVDFNTNSELLAMLRMFVQHQAAAHDAPMVVIENAHALNPSAMRVICDLANVRVRQTCALKLVLVSDRSLSGLINSPAMERIARRQTADFHMRPMSCEEATQYLHAKLTAAGSIVPSFVFPTSVCNELWDASGGWPGILDRISLLALASAAALPVEVGDVERPTLPDPTWDARTIEESQGQAGEPAAPPTLFVTEDGKKARQLSFEKPRLLIGRSEHNDICIDSQYVSRHHMLLVRHGSSTFLMDLNSTNGTFVNSRRVSNHALVDNDIISIGNHRIKFYDPHARQRGSLEGEEFADTAIMKTLDDMRALLARENTEVIPAPTENVPTLGN
jgi:pSer/pThr/pTyr-binding forkhead associated (FHA) protein/type II secretory pathway predicted ATPase ExeA